jgi:polysaccharide chain length determinant protein (PEP-CTERM system associated)
MNELMDMVLGYLRGIWRNRWYALACAWLVCLIGWVLVFRMPDQYEASARVYVDTQTMLRPVLQGLTVDMNPNTQVQLITRTLLSRPNLERIAQLTQLDTQARNPEALEALLDKLRSRIGFTAVGSRNVSDLYSITYKDVDPQLARRIVQVVVDVFEQNLVGNTQEGTDTAYQFLEKQITEHELRLIEAENRLKDFRIANFGRMPSDGQNYYTQIQQAASNMETARLELTQAENRRDALQQQLSRSVQQQLENEGESAIVMPIDARIQGLEQKLDELLIRYTDRHPDINILRQVIADLKVQRERERTLYAANIAESNPLTNLPMDTRTSTGFGLLDQLRIKLAEEEANIASLQVRVGEYDRRLKVLQEQINILPQIEADLVALNRDYDINQRRYQELLSRREALRLSEQAEQSKQNVSFRVIDPPRVPLKPSEPNRLLLMTVVLGAGLGAGVGLAFLIAQLWPTFDSRSSLARITDIPVFGSVSAVLSPVILRRERRWIAVYVSLGGMLVVTYAGLAVVERSGIL